MRYALAVLVLLALALPASAGNPYRLGGTPTKTSVGNKYSMRSQTGYRTPTHIYNYGVRDGDAYKYVWRRRGNHTDIVVYPDYPVVIKVEQPDHWERARLNYFQQMYGPNGVYSSHR